MPLQVVRHLVNLNAPVVSPREFAAAWWFDAGPETLGAGASMQCGPPPPARSSYRAPPVTGLPAQKSACSAPWQRLGFLFHENHRWRHYFDDHPPKLSVQSPWQGLGFLCHKNPPPSHRPRKVQITPRGKGWGFCATKTPPERHPPAAPTPKTPPSEPAVQPPWQGLGFSVPENLPRATSRIWTSSAARSAPVARVGVFWHGKPPARAPRNMRATGSTPTRLSGRSAPMARVGVFVIQKPLLYLSERRSCVRRAADRLDALEPISDAEATAGLRTAPTRV